MTGAGDFSKELVSFSQSVIVTEPGYIFVYVSNESNTTNWVYFDDLKITHTKSPVIQSDDYYPFGLTFNSYQRENSTKNNYLYNGKELQDELDLGWMDYGARMYMPEIGRFFKQDRFAEKYLSNSPYQYAMNNPIFYVDVNGDSVDTSNLTEAQLKIYNSQIELLMKSKMFATYYNQLLESETTYTVSAQKGEEGTSSEAGQFFDPKTNTVGVGENMDAYAVAQEFFHAYQKDGRFYSDDSPTPYSTMETEGDIASMYVTFEAGLATPMHGDWSNDFLMDAIDGIPSSEKVKSKGYQEMFQKAVDNRISYYKSTGLDVPTYTAPNTGVGPKAIEAVIELIKKK